jgi:hypothetical protein
VLQLLDVGLDRGHRDCELIRRAELHELRARVGRGRVARGHVERVTGLEDLLAVRIREYVTVRNP